MITEGELRRDLHAAVADEPPLGYDPGELVGRARHHLRRRRTVLASGVAATVVVALTFTLTTMLSLRPAPGLGDAAVGTAAPLTAPLELRPVLVQWQCEPMKVLDDVRGAPSPAPGSTAAPPTSRKFPTVWPPQPAPRDLPAGLRAKDAAGSFCYVLGAPIPATDHETTIQVEYGADGGHQLLFRLSPRGSQAFGTYTEKHVGEQVAFVNGSAVLSAPTIQAAIYGDIQITGYWDKAGAEAVWRRLTGR